MRRIAGWGVMPLVLAALSPLPAATGATTSTSLSGTVWITDRAGDRLAVYDLGSRTLLGTPSTEAVQDAGSADEPNDVAIALGKVYATNEASGTISVLDARTQGLLTRLPAGPKPHHAATSPSGDLVVYGVYGTNEVGFVDARTDTVRRVTASSRPGTVLSHSASFSADGRTVYVTNEVKSGDTQLPGTVAVVDVRTGAISCELDVGIRPSEAVVSRRGRFGYVSVRNENAVKEIDFAHCRLTGRAVDLGEQVDTLWLTADGDRMSVGLRGPAPEQSARVAMVDVKTFRQSHVRYWTIPGGTLTGHQYTTPDGRYTFAAFEGAGAGVAVIDHRANTVETLPAVGGRPHGIAFTKTPGC
jgi:DNA-binding beta-propeller fold protein YncE